MQAWYKGFLSDRKRIVFQTVLSFLIKVCKRQKSTAFNILLLPALGSITFAVAAQVKDMKKAL